MNIIDVNLRFNNLVRYNNTPKSLVVHHTECNGWTVERLNEFHRDENGWSGIGYHYYIRKDGQIFKGRPDDSIGAHVSGYNTNSLGIAFEGNYDENDKEMPKDQFNSWCELKKYLIDQYGQMNVYGHREVGSSDCPGKYFPLELIKNTKVKDPTEGYIISTYLNEYIYTYKNKYGNVFFNANKVIERVPSDVTIFSTTNDYGPWFETQWLPLDKCKQLASQLGNWVHEIVTR